MKASQNEMGYTLLLTLIIIIMITVFFSSFALSAMSQQKQVEKTDNTFEVTAIAEMGVEYYQAKVEAAIEIARLKIEELKRKYESDIAKSKTETERNNLKYNLDEAIKKVKSDLKTKIEGYQFINVEKTLGDNSEKSFGLKSRPIFDGEILIMNVVGNINSKEKWLTAYFNFPASLASPGPQGNTTGSTNGKYRALFEPPTFPETSKSSSINSCPLVDSTSGSINTEFICHSSSLDKLGNILNLNLYYTGNYELQNLNENFKNLNNFYANSSTKITNLKPKENSSFYINGETIIDSIDKPNNTTIYSKGKIEINSLNNIEKLNIYSNNTINFKNAIEAKNITLDAADVLFNNLNNTSSNLKIQVSGNANFKEINTISNSNFVINGTGIFQGQNTGRIIGNSILLLDSIIFTSNNNNILKLEDNSKLCIRNANYETIKHSINTTSHSELIILVNNASNVKNTGHVDLVMETEFNNRCNSNSIENEYPPANESFIKEIIYN